MSVLFHFFSSHHREIFTTSPLSTVDLQNPHRATDIEFSLLSLQHRKYHLSCLTSTNFSLPTYTTTTNNNLLSTQKISKSLQLSNLHNPGSGDAIGLNKTSGPKQTRTSADCRPQWSESTTLILFIFCNPRPAPSHPTKTPPPCKRILRQEQEALAAAARSLSVDEQDLLAASYGDVPLIELQSKTAEDVNHWTKVGSLTSALENRSVPIRGRAHTIRAVRKNMALVVVRERGFTVQCVATVHPDTVSRQMVKYVAGLSRDAAGGSSNEEVILCE